MNPLRPSPRLLRRVARLLGATHDPQVCAWVAAIEALPRPTQSRKFRATSVVQVIRDGRLCGYEVWRHLEKAKIDPTRKKARLFFGRRRCGGLRQALQLAYKSAALIARMSRRELHEWWAEYRAARAQHRPASNLWRDEQRYEDALDATDREQISHLFQKRKH